MEDQTSHNPSMLSIVIAGAFLFCSPPAAAEDSPQAVLEELRGLPGSVGLKLVQLGRRPEEIVSISPDRLHAVGSSFKLYVLLALEGERNWDRVLRFDPRLSSLGGMFRWAAGAPVTLYSLAAAMISQSDNTATDILIDHVGRRRVEDIMVEAGNEHAAMSIPLLTTLEFFKLKKDESLRRRFLAAVPDERRGLLAGEIARVPTDELIEWVSHWTRPVAIDEIEWFASSSDLCRLMARIHSGGDQDLLDILAINPGIYALDSRYSYIGYKGGSEPGVLSLNFLLKAKDGAVYAFSATWNDSAAPLDEGRFIRLIARLLELDHHPQALAQIQARL